MSHLLRAILRINRSWLWHSTTGVRAPWRGTGVTSSFANEKGTRTGQDRRVNPLNRGWWRLTGRLRLASFMHILPRSCVLYACRYILVNRQSDLIRYNLQALPVMISSSSSREKFMTCRGRSCSWHNCTLQNLAPCISARNFTIFHMELIRLSYARLSRILKNNNSHLSFQ